MARVSYPNGQLIGEVTDPALLAYYRSVEYTIDESDPAEVEPAEATPGPAEVIVPPSNDGDTPPDPPGQPADK